jgi:hypothetical protein
MTSDKDQKATAQQAIDPSQQLLENVAAARRAVAAAEVELDRVIGAIEVSPRVEKQVVSEAVSAALLTLRKALANLEAAMDILASSRDKA